MSHPRRRAGSPWSFRIATIAGIPVRVHITFLLFLFWLLLLSGDSGNRMFTLLVPSIFVCVLLHEFGHALVARAFGVKTRDVTLYPIGGVAMLESRPKPKQELWIALAGPMVNVVIAGGLAPAVVAVDGALPRIFGDLEKATYLQALFATNLLIPLFNMIPALPMDGGRVLRALLALRLPEVQATRISGGIAQLAAMGMGFWGLLSQNVFLVLIAMLVFIGAGQEVQSSVGMALIEGRRVADAMLTKFHVLSSGASLSEAADLLLNVSQSAFPVLVGEEVVGLLTREGIVAGLASQGTSAYVAGHMTREFQRLSPDQPLEDALRAITGANGVPALVFENEKLLGLVTPENLGEFMMVQQALRRR